MFYLQADPVRRKSLGLLGSLLTPHYGDYEVYQSIGELHVSNGYG